MPNKTNKNKCRKISIIVMYAVLIICFIADFFIEEKISARMILHAIFGIIPCTYLVYIALENLKKK